MKTATNMKDQEDNRAEQQAKAQFESIKAMVEALEQAGDDDNKREEADQTIQEDPLSVEVRSNWHTPGSSDVYNNEYMILLCTGGPACRIIGELDGHDEPDNARLEYQDWGTPWTEYRLTSDEEQIVLKYCRCFYFGD